MANPGSLFYDVLLLGGTGQGKSTLANKLVSSDESNTPLSELSTQDEVFETGDGAASMTKGCKSFYSVTTRIKVTDTPGFSIDDFSENLKIFKEIILEQKQCELEFRRVLYVLPSRGPIETIDVLKEEIRLMHGFLGLGVFNIMVIIATHQKQKAREDPNFDESDIRQTELAFMTAFKEVIEGDTLPKCPPILYLPFYGEMDLIKEIKKAPVIHDNPLKPQDGDDAISQCTQCSAKIIHGLSTAGSTPLRVVLNEGEENETILLHKDSKCHPQFIPAHYTATKIIGGLGHIATLGIFAGIGALRGKEVWPTFTNTDKICVACNKPPGTEGCTKINEMFTPAGTCNEPIKTSHHIKDT